MSEQLGKLVLRLGLGGLVLFHGVHKLLTGLDPVKAMLTSHGLPEALAYAAYFGEIVAPVLIILGLFTRIGGALIALEVLGLVVLGGIPQVVTISPDGAYGLEVEALYFTGAVAVMLMGAGRISLGRGRWS
ncbi:MAG TPA: DoxX family protein [Rhizomicrobium sp.]|nr:DoxX family protein [Rhizomicrobium sp.]